MSLISSVTQPENEFLISFDKQKSKNDELSMDQLEYDIAGHSVKMDIVAKTLASFDWWRKVDLSYRKLSSTDLSEFKDGLLSVQQRKYQTIRVFDVSGNENIDLEGFTDLGVIVNHCYCTVLKIANCHLSHFDISALSKSLGNAKVNNLDVSGNNELGPVGFLILGKVVLKCGVDFLNFAKCQPSFEAIENFLKSLENAKISRLNASGNVEMKNDAFAKLGSLVRQCESCFLSIAYCKPSSLALLGFMKNLVDSKLRKVDMRGNGDLEVEGKSFIGCLIKDHGVLTVVLDLLESDLQSIDFNLLKHTLKKQKVNILDLSTVIGERGKLSFEYKAFEKSAVFAIANFLPFVSNQIKLLGWELCEDSVSFLKHALRLLFPTDLIIRYGARGSIRKLLSTELRQDDIFEGKALSGRELAKKRKLSFDDSVKGKSLKTNELVLSKLRVPIIDPEKKLEYRNKLHVHHDSRRKLTKTSGYDLDARIQKSINSKSKKVQNIDASGGTINKHGCSAEFEPHTLKHETKVKITVYTKDDDVSEGYEPFGPTVRYWAYGRKLWKPVSLRIASYFLPEEDDDIEVWTKKPQWKNWKRVPPISYENGKCEVKFKAPHFCLFKVIRKVCAAMKSICYKPDMILNNNLYYHASRRIFVALFCIDNDKIKEDCSTSISNDGYQQMIPLPHMITINSSKSLKCRLQCDSPEVNIIPSDWETLDLADFPATKYKIFYFLLKPLVRISGTDLAYFIEKEGKVQRTPVTIPPPRLQERTNESQIEREFDIFADVSPEFAVKKSTDGHFRSHVGKESIYQISVNKDCKGKVLIINNEFKQKPNARKGSEVDVKNMEALWTKMGFKVDVEENLTAEEMQHHCQVFAKDPEPSSVRVVIMMSHGKQDEWGRDKIAGECGKFIFIKDIVRKFYNDKCQHLIGIPKIFIFQCCRGPGDEGVLHDETDQMVKMPTICDIFEVYACTSGTASHRRSSGSWLINAITNVFKDHACDHDIKSLFTKVNGDLARRESERRITTKQICETRENLVKYLHLFPGHP